MWLNFLCQFTSAYFLTLPLKYRRLVTGAVQLAEGTHLTLDETALQAGTLGTIGVQNLEVLKHLLEWQKVRKLPSWEPYVILLGTIYLGVFFVC